MAKITLTYPASGLTIEIVVKNRATGTTEFSGTMTEIGTTSIYKYDFTEVAGNDYVYTATNATYPTLSGTLYDDSAISSDSISMAQAVRTEIAVELARIDRNLSDIGAIGGGGGVRNNNYEVRPEWIKELLDKQKKEIIKELYKEPIEKVDLTPIINKIDKIEIPNNIIEKETLKKVVKIEKYIESKILKEEILNKKEQKIIDDIFILLDKYREEENSILDMLRKMEEEEINNILKLIK